MAVEAEIDLLFIFDNHRCESFTTPGITIIIDMINILGKIIAAAGDTFFITLKTNQGNQLMHVLVGDSRPAGVVAAGAVFTLRNGCRIGHFPIACSHGRQGHKAEEQADRQHNTQYFLFHVFLHSFRRHSRSLSCIFEYINLSVYT